MKIIQTAKLKKKMKCSLWMAVVSNRYTALRFSFKFLINFPVQRNIYPVSIILAPKNWRQKHVAILISSFTSRIYMVFTSSGWFLNACSTWLLRADSNRSKFKNWRFQGKLDGYMCWVKYERRHEQERYYYSKCIIKKECYV